MSRRSLAVPHWGGSPTKLSDVTSRDAVGTTSVQDKAATTRKPPRRVRLLPRLREVRASGVADTGSDPRLVRHRAWMKRVVTERAAATTCPGSLREADAAQIDRPDLSGRGSDPRLVRHRACMNRVVTKTGSGHHLHAMPSARAARRLLVGTIGQPYANDGSPRSSATATSMFNSPSRKLKRSRMKGHSWLWCPTKSAGMRSRRSRLAKV